MLYVIKKLVCILKYEPATLLIRIKIQKTKILLFSNKKTIYVDSSLHVNLRQT